MYFQHLSLYICIGRYMCLWYIEVCCKSNIFQNFCLGIILLLLTVMVTTHFVVWNIVSYLPGLSLKEGAVTCKLLDQSASCMQWIQWIFFFDQKRRDRYTAYYKTIYILLYSMHLKIIVLESVTNSKSEKMWNLFISLFFPQEKTTLKNVWFCGNFQL